MDVRGRFWPPTDIAAAPAREPPHHCAEAQPEPVRLRENHPCSRERIHTITHDRQRRVAVTIFRPMDCRTSLRVISSEVEKSLEAICLAGRQHRGRANWDSAG